MRVFEEKIANKYRYYVGEESTINGVKRIVHLSGYFMTRKAAENRLEELRRKA